MREIRPLSPNKMDSYVIFVDSNVVDARTGTTNTCSSFVNILDPPLDLGDEGYEVGIKEIQYPITWYNIPEDAYCVLLFRQWHSTSVISESSEPFIVLKEGRYMEIDFMMTQINAAIKNKFVKHFSTGKPPSFVRLSHDDKMKTHHLSMNTGEEGAWNVQAVLTLQLAEMLGFRNFFFDSCTIPGKRAKHCEIAKLLEVAHPNLEFDSIPIRSESTRHYGAMAIVPKWKWSKGGTDHPILEKGMHPADFPFDINNGRDKLVITSDCAKHHQVGNQSRQVLQIVPVPASASYGENGYNRYDQPFYFPISQQVIEQIEIHVRDREGKFIDFKRGSIIIALHIRRCR